jgi:hypothetical protein
MSLLFAKLLSGGKTKPQEATYGCFGQGGSPPRDIEYSH